MEGFQTNGLSDHDLLIELRTEMKGVRSDVKDLKDNTSKRVDALEAEKADKAEIQRLLTDAEKVHSDHETRLRTVEREQDNFKGRYAVIAALAVIIVSAAVSWIVSHIH